MRGRFNFPYLFLFIEIRETESPLLLKAHTGSYISLYMNIQFKTETLFPEILFYIVLAELLRKSNIVNYIEQGKI